MLSRSSARETRGASRGEEGWTAGLLSFALAAVLAGNSLPAPLLPRYLALWSLPAVSDTMIFAVYALGVVAALLLAGGIADEVGPRPVLAAAIPIAMLAGLLALLAPTVALLYAARIIQGVAAGLAGSAATSALTHTTGDPSAAARLTALGTTGGIALGLLLAGGVSAMSSASVAWPWVSYLVLLCIAAAVMASIGGLRPLRRPNLTVIPPALPRGDIADFLRAIAGASLAFACVGLLAGLGPSIALAIGVSGVFLAAVISALTYVISAAILATGRPRVKTAWPGLFVLTVGLVLVFVAVWTVSVGWLLMGSAAIGAGNGLTFRVTLMVVNRVARDEHRAGTISTYNLAMYGGVVAPVLAVGLIAGATSLRTATAVTTAVVGAWAIVLAALDRAAEAHSIPTRSSSPKPEDRSAA